MSVTEKPADTKFFILIFCWAAITCTNTNVNHSVHENFSNNTNYTTLDSNLKIETIRGDKIYIKDVFEKKTLVLRIKQNHCKTCIKSIFERIKHSKFKNFNDVLVLTDYNDRRFIQFNFPNDEYLLANTYRASSANLEQLELYEQINYPYYFIIDQNLHISSLHIMSAEPNRDLSYLDSLGKVLVL